MKTVKAISNRDDIIVLVNSFYEKVQKDELLGPVFSDQAHVNWQSHLPQMYNFWESLLLGADNFSGRPLAKHLPLMVTREHFARWLELFSETVDAHFAGLKADEAKRRAVGIAYNFQVHMGLLRANEL